MAADRILARPPQEGNMTTELQRMTERAVGLHRAAQLLADATACRQGIAPQSLKTMARADAAWFRQVARQVVECFEGATIGAQIDPKEQRAAELESAVGIERSRGRVAAAARGHELGHWAPVLEGRLDEVAVCSRCRRIVTIEVRDRMTVETALDGPALIEGCLAGVVSGVDVGDAVQDPLTGGGARRIT
jgi:hypothetical protein